MGATGPPPRKPPANGRNRVVVRESLRRSCSPPLRTSAIGEALRRLGEGVFQIERELWGLTTTTLIGAPARYSSCTLGSSVWRSGRYDQLCGLHDWRCRCRLCACVWSPPRGSEQPMDRCRSRYSDGAGNHGSDRENPSPTIVRVNRTSDPEQVNGKGHGGRVHERMDFGEATVCKLDQNVRDESESDPMGDGIGQWDHQQDQKGRNRGAP